MSGELFVPSLKTGIDVFLDAFRHCIGRTLSLEYREVVVFSVYGLSQEPNASFLVGDYDVLSGVFLLLAGIVLFLFLSVPGSLNRTFRSVDKEFLGFGKESEEFFHVTDLSFGKNNFSLKRFLQQSHHFELPSTGIASVTIIENGEKIVSGVTFAVQKNEEKFFDNRGYKSLSSSPDLSFGSFPSMLSFLGKSPFFLECRKKIFKFFPSESGEGRKGAGIVEDSFEVHRKKFCFKSFLV